MMLYSRADTWLGWGKSREADRPLREYVADSAAVVPWVDADVARSEKRDEECSEGSAGSYCGSDGSVGAARGCRGAARRGGKGRLGRCRATARNVARPGGAGTFDNVFTLADIGVNGYDCAARRGCVLTRFTFRCRSNELVKTATMKLRYHFSPGLLPAMSHLKVSLNGRCLRRCR